MYELRTRSLSFPGAIRVSIPIRWYWLHIFTILLASRRLAWLITRRGIAAEIVPQVEGELIRTSSLGSTTKPSLFVYFFLPTNKIVTQLQPQTDTNCSRRESIIFLVKYSSPMVNMAATPENPQIDSSASGKHSATQHQLSRALLISNT